jgi:hypothetical protein
VKKAGEDVSGGRIARSFVLYNRADADPEHDQGSPDER